MKSSKPPLSITYSLLFKRLLSFLFSIVYGTFENKQCFIHSLDSIDCCSPEIIFNRNNCSILLTIWFFSGKLNLHCFHNASFFSYKWNLHWFHSATFSSCKWNLHYFYVLDSPLACTASLNCSLNSLFHLTGLLTYRMSHVKIIFFSYNTMEDSVVEATKRNITTSC